MALAERVHKPTLKQLGEALALLVREARALVVVIGARKVDLLVCHVKVAAGHNRLVLGKLGEKVAVARIPLHALVQARKAVLGVWRVHVDKPQLGELKRAHAALVVGNGRANCAHNLQWLLAREDGRTRVALALGIAPVLVVAGKVKLDLALLELGLLQGKDVCAQRVEDLDEAGLLFEHGAKAVYVP